MNETNKNRGTPSNQWEIYSMNNKAEQDICIDGKELWLTSDRPDDSVRAPKDPQEEVNEKVNQIFWIGSTSLKKLYVKYWANTDIKHFILLES